MEVSGEFNAVATLPPGKDSTLSTVWEGGPLIFHTCSHYFVHPAYMYRYTYSSSLRMDREPHSIADV
jgi:hypothetical protein